MFYLMIFKLLEDSNNWIINLPFPMILYSIDQSFQIRRGVLITRFWLLEVEEVYGIPRDQVIGSSVKTEFVIKDGKPAINRLPEIDFIDDEAKEKGWAVINMKEDWKVIYPFELVE